MNTLEGQPGMNIELNLYASLARYLPREAEKPSNRIRGVAEGTTIQALLLHHQVPMGRVKLIFLNGIHARGDEFLKDGDRVGVFPAVAGG
jgi:molybdopterin converting factor small subunit